MINSIPFVIFAFMYQQNVPMIYRELKIQKYSNMNKVVGVATIVVVLIYVIASTFGYLNLVNQPESLDELLEKKNILEVDYKNISFTIAVCFLLLPIIAAAPIAVLPSKDVIEHIFFKENGMSKKQNLIVTIVMVLG